MSRTLNKTVVILKKRAIQWIYDPLDSFIIALMLLTGLCFDPSMNSGSV